MSKLLIGLVAASVAVAAPAAAQTVAIDLSGNSGVSGADGNGRFYRGVNGTTIINVRASGWSLDGLTVRDSFLGAFANGLGVTSGDDAGGANNRHAVDNHTRRDFILLQFDQAVNLASGDFDTYSILRNSKDSDATVGFGTTSLDWRRQLPLNNAGASTLAAMLSGGVTSFGTGTGGSRNLGTGTATGNLWLIGAAFDNKDGLIDGFKLDGITVSPVVSAVPEPGTWATMLVGFGAIGASMRRRRPGRVLAAA